MPDFARNIERAIDRVDFDTRITAIEDELMALAESASAMADALASMERMMVTIATAARVQTDQLARIEALSRGRLDPLPSEEGHALLNAYQSKETR